MSTKKKSVSTRTVQAKPKVIPSSPVKPLLTDVRGLILEARQRVAQTVNTGLTLLYWQIGYRIRQDILKEKRAAYGAEIVHALSGQLTWTHFRQMELYLRWLDRYERESLPYAADRSCRRSRLKNVRWRGTRKMK